MELTVRTFHGTADVSIDLHDRAATLREVITATTGQAAPVAATVDGRVVDTGDTIGGCRVMVGSVIDTDLDATDDHNDTITTLVQLTGPGAGRTVPLAAGRYRIGTGRRASSAELSFESVDTVAFELDVTTSGVRVSNSTPPQSPQPHAAAVFLNDEILSSRRDWVAGHLIAGTRTFALDAKRPTTRSIDWQAVNPDGTVVHNRPPGLADDPVFMVDAIRHSRDRDSRLWHRRLRDGPLQADIGLVVYHGQPDKSGTLRRPAGPPPKRRLTASVEFDIDRVVALAGTDDDRTALARALIIDLATRYGPADADIVIATNPSTLGDWDWVKWLPHLHDHGAVQILTNELEMSRFANAAIDESHFTEYPTHMTVVIVTDDELWNSAGSPLRSLVLEGPRSVAIIALTTDQSTAPATTGALVSLDAERPGAAKLVSLTQGGEDVPLLVGLVDIATAEMVARRLAPLVDPDRPNSRAGFGQPTGTTLSAILRADEAAMRWDTGLGAVDKPVEIPIGTIAGIPIGIDLGANSGVLVSGSSLAEAAGITSMMTLAVASTWSPKEATVITIDHRTERHDDVVQHLPHHAGTYSDRGPESGQMLIARLRTAVLGADRTHPRLIVVVNGVADSELAVPGLTSDLAALASEAIGFHLVAATALPLASLDGALRAVCPIEIAVDRYGGTRRATLHDPRRRLHSPFTPPDDSASVDRTVEVRPLVFGRQPTALERRLERGPLAAPEPGDRATERIARTLGSLAHERGDQRALPLLPMPLPSTIGATELFAAHPGDGVPLGLVDQLDAFAPTPLWWQPGPRGSLLIFGSPRSGMRSAIDTLIVGVIDRFATVDVELWLIDHIDHRRDAAALAPHVTRAVSPDHPGDLAELLANAVDEVQRRSAQEDFRISDHPSVIMCIRGVDRLPTTAHEVLVDLFVEGPAVGVNVIASATRPDGLSELIAACSDILVGELSDRTGYDAFGLSRSPVLEQRSGRCRHRNGEIVQLATLDQSFDATVRELAAGFEGGRVDVIAAGSGVGIEFCEHVLRGVLLLEGSVEPAATAEVSLRSVDDDQAVYDSLIRLRAELGGPELPTRIATFPPGSHMRRIDVTDKTGPELNALRADIDRRHHTSSTMLVDDGPRRWMHVVDWPIGRIRRLEELAERAGLIDVAVEPSPAALVRCLATSTTYVERSAAAGDAFVAALDAGVPVAAVSVSAVGRSHPQLIVGRRPFSVPMFDGVVDASALAEQIDTVGRSQSDRNAPVDNVELLINGSRYPPFPPHDLRAPERQCVAIGAAIGAAGLAGRLRPVDIIADDAQAVPPERRPWVVERVGSVAPRPSASRPRVGRRMLARLHSRRQ